MSVLPLVILGDAATGILGDSLWTALGKFNTHTHTLATNNFLNAGVVVNSLVDILNENGDTLVSADTYISSISLDGSSLTISSPVSINGVCYLIANGESLIKCNAVGNVLTIVVTDGFISETGITILSKVFLPYCLSNLTANETRILSLGLGYKSTITNWQAVSNTTTEISLYINDIQKDAFTVTSMGVSTTISNQIILTPVNKISIKSSNALDHLFIGISLSKSLYAT